MARAPLAFTLVSALLPVMFAASSSAQTRRPARAAPTLATASRSCPVRTPADTAAIEGSLYFPAPGPLPAMTVVALRQSPTNGCAYYISTARGVDRYRLEGLPAGDYIVVAYATDSAGRARAGSYTDSVTCMAVCGQHGNCCRHAHHTPIVIHLGTQRVRHVSIADWEATLPARPAEIP